MGNCIERPMRCGWTFRLPNRYMNELLWLWDEWKDTFARGQQGELEVMK